MGFDRVGLDAWQEDRDPVDVAVIKEPAQGRIRRIGRPLRGAGLARRRWPMPKQQGLNLVIAQVEVGIQEPEDLRPALDGGERDVSGGRISTPQATATGSGFGFDWGHGFHVYHVPNGGGKRQGIREKTEPEPLFPSSHYLGLRFNSRSCSRQAALQPVRYSPQQNPYEPRSWMR